MGRKKLNSSNNTILACEDLNGRLDTAIQLISNVIKQDEPSNGRIKVNQKQTFLLT